MSTVHLTDRAMDDLQGIYDYSIREWGQTTALKYMRAFDSALSIIGQNSGLIRINRKISSKFSVYNVRNHYLICDVIEAEVYVLTVKHVSMDLLERLKDLEPQLDKEVSILKSRLNL